MFKFCPMCGTKINPTRKNCVKCNLDLIAYQKKLNKLAGNVEVKAVPPEKPASLPVPEIKSENQSVVKAEIKSEKPPVTQNITTPKIKTEPQFTAYNKFLEEIKLSGKNIEDLSAAEWLNAGYQAYLDKDFESALKLFEESANLGDADALCWQGRIYDPLEEDGGEKDAVKAFDLYKKAADAGSIFAIHRCGVHYILGDSVPKDTETGMALVKKAADNYYKFAYSTLANESKEPSKKFRYAKKFLATNDPNAKEQFGFLVAPELAFVKAANPAHFNFFNYQLTVDDTLAFMGAANKMIAGLTDVSINNFKKIYEDYGHEVIYSGIEGFIEKVETVGTDILLALAEKNDAIQVANCNITAKDLVFETEDKLTDIKGRSISYVSDVAPGKIWINFVKKINEHYSKFFSNYKEFVNSQGQDYDEWKSGVGISFANEFTDNLVKETLTDSSRFSKIDSPNDWQDVGGYDFVNRVFKIVKSENLIRNYKNFDSVENIFTQMFESTTLATVYKNSKIFDAYLMGLLISIETLKFRTFAALGFDDPLGNFEKSDKIIKKLEKITVSEEETKKNLYDALISYPINFNIYEYALRRFGDPEGDLERIAVTLHLGEFLETKKKILFERLENNPDISNTFKDILFNNADPVEALSYENFSTLKQDFRSILSEAAKLQVPTVGDNKFCQIFDIYKTAIKSFKADKHSENRIKTFEHIDENFKSFDVPEGVTEIGGYSFANCRQLEKIKFPSTLKKIDAGAFYNCNFTAIELPYGVEEISINLANKDSTADTIVYLPKSLQRINGNYLVTSSHTKFVFDTVAMPFINDYFKYTCRYNELVSVLTEEEAKNNYSDKTLNTNAGILEKGIFNNKEIFNDDEFVVTANFARYVQDNCFENSNVKEINFGDNLREVKSFAFAGCNNLKNLILPAGTEYLGDSICADCKNLESLTIPDTVKYIGKNILSGTNAIVYCSPNSYADEYCRKNNISVNDTSSKDIEISTLKDNKQIMSKKELLFFREELFRDYGDVRCIYFPEKSEKAIEKFKNALASYAVGTANETLIFLYDDTLFGSAKDGFLVTNKAIYYHNYFDDSSGCLLFENITEISPLYESNEMLIKCAPNFMDNNEYKINMKRSNDIVMEQIAKMLNEVKKSLME